MRSRGTFVVVAGISVLLATGCARKKAPPERGVVIGSARFSASFALDLYERHQFDSDIHCMQIVKLREDKTKVVEISRGACPKSDSHLSSKKALSNDVIATLRLTNVGDQPKLHGHLITMGDSSKETENTPVGLYKNISTDKEEIVEIEALCENYKQRIQFDELCRIDYLDGAITNVAVFNPMSLDSVALQMGIKNLENADQIKESIRLANIEIVKINGRLNDADKLLKKLEGRISEDTKATKSLTSLINAASTALANLKTEHATFTTDSNKNLDTLAERLTEIKGRYMTVVSKDTNDMIASLDSKIKETNEKLSKLIAKENHDKISELNAKMKASNESLTTLLAKENSDKITALNGMVKEAGDKFAELLSKENMDKLVALNANVADSSKKLMDAASAIEKKIESIQIQMSKVEMDLKPKSEEAKRQLTEMSELAKSLALELKKVTSEAQAELEQLNIRKKSILELELSVLQRAKASLLEEKNEAEINPELNVSEVIERATKVNMRIDEVSKMISEIK